MKVSPKIKRQIRCVLAQTNGDWPVKQKHIRLEINSWRSKSRQISDPHYFGLVMQQLQTEGFLICVRATATHYSDEFKSWMLAEGKPKNKTDGEISHTIRSE